MDKAEQARAWVDALEFIDGMADEGMTYTGEDQRVLAAAKIATALCQATGVDLDEEWAGKVTAALSLPRSEEWRDISTAPRDSSFFLGYNGHWIGVARYFEPNYEEDPSWVDETLAFIEPGLTHWRPLPAPPALTTGGE